jgi:hypothetical protein
MVGRSTMIIKIQHPNLKEKTLLIEARFNKETRSFQEVNTRSELDVLPSNDKCYGNGYMVAVHDTAETREDWQFDLESSEEELTWELDTVYAPALDAILCMFFDTGSVETSDEYKIWQI